MKLLLRWTAHPRFPLHAALLALLLGLPALGLGWLGDDHVHRCVLHGAGPFPGSSQPVLDLFSFVDDGATSASAAWREKGLFPWWTDPGMRATLFRPLAAATHLLDARLWPESAPLQHAHSLLWLAAGVLLVTLLYRRLFDDERPRQPLDALAAAGLAGLLFAVEDAHALPAGWLANRNALLALTFGSLGLLAHLRWRRSGGWPWLAAALLAMAAGLLGAEAALGALAYVVAYQLTLDRRSWPKRLLALLPYAVLVLAWRALYVGLGYGVRRSGLYVDPAADPLGFAAALVERGPLLLASQFFPFSTDLWLVTPRASQLALSALAWLLCLLLLLPFRRLLWGGPTETLRLPEGPAALRGGAAASGEGAAAGPPGETVPVFPASLRALARFFALGMLLALVPVSAAFPMDRLLLFTGIGAFGLLACLIRALGWLGAPAVLPQPRGLGAFAAAMLLLHLLFAPLCTPLRLALLQRTFAGLSRVARQLPDDPALGGQTLVFVHGHDLMDATILLERAALGLAMPARVALLAPLSSALDVTRLDEHTLLLRPAAGWLAEPFDRLFGDLDDAALPPGRRIAAPDFTAEVRSLTTQGRPAAVLFRFARPLEHPSLRWVRFDRPGLVSWQPPPVGASERIAVSPEVVAGW